MIASITIRFWKETRIDFVVTTLRHIGWFFDYGLIVCDYWRDINDLGDNRQEFSEDQWPVVSEILQQRIEEGYRTVVQLSSEVCDCEGNFVFESPKCLRVTFDGPRPRLEECHRFTDFSSLLKQIVCPMAAAGLSLAEVTCVDDRS